METGALVLLIQIFGTTDSQAHQLRSLWDLLLTKKNDVFIEQHLISKVQFYNQRFPHNNAIKSEALYTGKQDIDKSSGFLVIIQSQLFTIAVSCCKKSS